MRHVSDGHLVCVPTFYYDYPSSNLAEVYCWGILDILFYHYRWQKALKLSFTRRNIVNFDLQKHCISNYSKLRDFPNLLIIHF